MAIAYYYFNAYSSSGWSDPAYMVDGNTSTGAYLFATTNAYATVTKTENQRCSGNECVGTSLGRITKVEMRYRYDIGRTLFIQNPVAGRNYVNTTPYFNGSAGTLRTMFDVSGTAAVSATWTGWYDITSDANHPTWGTDWDDVKNMDMNVFGYVSYTGEGWSTNYGGLIQSGYAIQLAITYTPYAASTGSITSPTAAAIAYRSGTGLAINGTAVNAVGVNKVQYKVDAGSWVDCTGTTAWSVTVPQSSLTLGAHTIYVQVQEVGSGTWTAVDNVAIVQSPLPSQMI